MFIGSDTLCEPPCSTPYLFAFDEATGAPLWTQSFYADGNAVGSLAFQPASGVLWASDATGLVWQVDPASGSAPFIVAEDGSRPDLLVDGGSLFVVYDDVESYHPPSFNWLFSGSSGVAAPAAAFGGIVYMSVGGSVFGLRESDGTVLWVNRLGGQVSGPAVDADGVFVGGDALTALDPAAGAVLWRRDIRSTTPAINGRRLIVNAVEAGGLYALDASSGRTLWSNPVTGRARGIPAIANGVAYEVGESGSLFAVDTANGKVLASVNDPLGLPLDSGTDRAPRNTQVAIADGSVYVPTAASAGPVANRVDVFNIPSKVPGSRRF